MISSRFIGTVRLQVFEHKVIEAHPDDVIPDLRLDRPLKAFQEQIGRASCRERV